MNEECEAESEAKVCADAAVAVSATVLAWISMSVAEEEEDCAIAVVVEFDIALNARSSWLDEARRGEAMLIERTHKNSNSILFKHNRVSLFNRQGDAEEAHCDTTVCDAAVWIVR